MWKNHIYSWPFNIIFNIVGIFNQKWYMGDPYFTVIAISNCFVCKYSSLCDFQKLEYSRKTLDLLNKPLFTKTPILSHRFRTSIVHFHYFVDHWRFACRHASGGIRLNLRFPLFCTSATSDKIISRVH